MPPHEPIGYSPYARKLMELYGLTEEDVNEALEDLIDDPSDPPTAWTYDGDPIYLGVTGNQRRIEIVVVKGTHNVRSVVPAD